MRGLADGVGSSPRAGYDPIIIFIFIFITIKISIIAIRAVTVVTIIAVISMISTVSTSSIVTIAGIVVIVPIVNIVGTVTIATIVSVVPIGGILRIAGLVAAIAGIASDCGSGYQGQAPASCGFTLFQTAMAPQRSVSLAGRLLQCVSTSVHQATTPPSRSSASRAMHKFEMPRGANSTTDGVPSNAWLYESPPCFSDVATRGGKRRPAPPDLQMVR